MIPKLIRTAKALRRARRMQQEFMLMWALDRARHLDEVRQERQTQPLKDLADPNHRDWRMFYRGSVLDD